MNILQLLPRYVITLTNVPERLAQAKTQPDFRIFPAFDIRNYSLTPGIKGRHPTNIKELGCLFSHTAIIKMAKANELPGVMISEDDALFHPTFPDGLPDPPPDWQLIYFGTWILSNNDEPREPVIGYPGVYHAVPVMGAHAYALRQSAYDLVCDEALLPTSIPIDLALYNLVASRRLKAYTTVPFFARQGTLPSQITGSRTLPPLERCARLFKT